MRTLSRHCEPGSNPNVTWGDQELARCELRSHLSFSATPAPAFPTLPLDTLPLFIRNRVIDVFQRWHEADLSATKFPFERTDICPSVIRLSDRDYAHPIIAFTPERFCLTHDLEMQQVRCHQIAMNRT